MERCSKSLAIREIEVKTIIDHTHWDGYSQKEDIEKLEPLYGADRTFWKQ